MSKPITITATLWVEKDMSVPSFGTHVAGLPEGDNSPEEALADSISDALSAAVRAHNETVFKRRQS